MSAILSARAMFNPRSRWISDEKNLSAQSFRGAVVALLCISRGRAALLRFFSMARRGYDWIAMTYQDLQRRLHDKSFRPFRIRMVNSTLYDIREPWMVMLGESSAVIATQTRKDDKGYQLAADWKTVSISHMMELSDLDVRSNGAKRKK